MSKFSTPKKRELRDISNVVVPNGYMLVKKPFPSTTVGAQMRAAKRKAEAEDKTTTEQAVTLWRGIITASTEQEKEQLLTKLGELVKSALGNTRAVSAQQTPVVFSPDPTKNQIVTASGLPEHAFLATQRRLERNKDHLGQDRRVIGLPHERNLVATFAKEMAVQRTSVSRVMLATSLLQMLKQRNEAFKAGKAVPPLNAAEKDVLARAASVGNPFSDGFWRCFEAEHDLSRKTLRQQHVGRTENFTRETCTDFLTKFDEVLKDMNFFITKSKRTGYIKEECMQDIWYTDECPGMVGELTLRGYSADGTLDGAAVPGGEYNPTVTILLNISMLGVVAIPHWIASSQHKSLTLAKTLFENYDLFWTATKNGYVDIPTTKSYALRLCQQVGHDRPLVLMMDGHAAHLSPEVVSQLLRLNIRGGCHLATHLPWPCGM